MRDLEEKLLQPEFRRNRESVSSLLADEFREIGSSGRLYNKQQALDLLAGEPPSRVELADFQCAPLTPDIVLVNFRTTRPDGPPTPNAACLRTSIWVRREERWQLIFHQGTPATY